MGISPMLVLSVRNKPIGSWFLVIFIFCISPPKVIRLNRGS